MSVSGPDALRALEEALRDIRREEDEVARRLARSAELVAKMREQEGELLRQLASGRLDAATQAALSAQLADVEGRMRHMLTAHNEAIATGEAGLAALDEVVAKVGADRVALQVEAQQRHADLTALAAKVRPALSRDATFAAKRASAAALSAIAEESVRKTAQAEADREQKGRPYRDDPLFMYLWERGHGTGAYRANGLVSFLDGRVAALIGFSDARANYSMLSDIPVRLRQHAERQQELAKAAADEVAALEKAATEAAGGGPVREAMEQVVGRIAALDAEVVTLQDRRDIALAAQRELAEGGVPAFAAATADFARVLERDDLKAMLDDARAAGNSREMTIVQQIDDLRQRAKEEYDEIGDHRARLKTLAARRRDLEDIQYEFKARGFDNPRCSFSDEHLVGDLLNDFLRGSATAAKYWTRWQRSQSWNVAADADPLPGGEFKPGRPDEATSALWGWAANEARQTPGYGGPGGGWGQISTPTTDTGTVFSRPRARALAVGPKPGNRFLSRAAG